MTTVLVTGSAGFIGKHLMEALGRRLEVRALGFDIGSTDADLDQALASANVILHLAGVNRPQKVEEFAAGNRDFTAEICAKLNQLGRKPVIVLSSSIQAELENPYGVSKRQAEQVLVDWSEKGGGASVIFRLKNVFGKWCRPNYNSVTATFCHNIAHDLPITISDPSKELELVYIDDVVAAFMAVLDESPVPGTSVRREVPQSYKITLGDMAERIRSFRQARKNLTLPSFADGLTRRLYGMYLSYLEKNDFGYSLDLKTDPRGCLAEFMKSEAFGQIFVSRTKPGITRGNHYHHTKTEKFLVLEGEAIIRFRSIQPGVGEAEVIEYRISGKDFKVVDIPPGYAHSIENVGATEMVVLFWSSEVFDPQRPETYAKGVLQ